ncbi:hypothetical protein SAMN02787144_1009184 [Streptomyces atratus]|uniref:Uncharacterized protein n=1 Tax=Streptomyces atratus TaxID=1893 RepID=A0A1K2BUW2_STRAR|nr:hypothetical protein SAMN02787144_1009184 [Streptomyces atratus]
MTRAADTGDVTPHTVSLPAAAMPNSPSTHASRPDTLTGMFLSLA